MSTYQYPGTSCRHVYVAPSRRLGRSFGVDLVPHKVCSFDCTYCQLGRTTELSVTRRPGPPVELLVLEVQEALARGPRPDFLTLSGSGEPTLYEPLGALIAALGRVFRPLAVLTNGSLLRHREVRDALCGADVVLPSLDAADEDVFQHVNRPHPDLSLAGLVDGMAAFRREFRGAIWLEIMMLGGVTAIPAQAAQLAELASGIGPDRIHLNTVVRPPAEASALPAPGEDLEALCGLFQPRAEVIGEAQVPKHIEPVAAEAGAVLSILRRRPCTVGDLATALSAPSPAVVKTLQTLLHRQAVRVRICDRHVFYSVDEGVSA